MQAGRHEGKGRGCYAQVTSRASDINMALTTADVLSQCGHAEVGWRQVRVHIHPQRIDTIDAKVSLELLYHGAKSVHQLYARGVPREVHFPPGEHAGQDIRMFTAPAQGDQGRPLTHTSLHVPRIDAVDTQPFTAAMDGLSHSHLVNTAVGAPSYDNVSRPRLEEVRRDIHRLQASQRVRGEGQIRTHPPQLNRQVTS
jgi:hypothetical protein